MKIRGPLVTLGAVATDRMTTSRGVPVLLAVVLLLTRKGLRAWVIPNAGGLVLFGLVYVWLTSALWFFQTSGVTL